jgi:hypothetical protein
MMNSKPALSALIARLKEGRAAHFHLIESSRPEPETSVFLDEFVEEAMVATIGFFKKNLSLQTCQKLVRGGHPDILLLKNREGKDYLKEEFEVFFRFLELATFEFPRRFVVIANAHRISDLMANKMLKSLEDTPGGITIFMLNPTQAPLLPTLRGRALILRVPSPTEQVFQTDVANSTMNEWFVSQLHSKDRPIQDKTVNETFETFLKTRDPHDLIAMLKKKSTAQDELLALILKRECQLGDGRRKSILLEHLKWAMQARTFNNSSAEMLFTVLSSLR